MEKTKPVTLVLCDLVDQIVAESNEIAAAIESGQRRGVMTGHGELDELLGGYLAPGLHILQAAPGAGKTAFALQTAATCEFPALYVSAEMGQMELFKRLIANQTETYLGKLKSGEIYGDQMRRLALATSQKVPSLALMDATQAYASPRLIEQVIEGLRERRQARHALIVIDSLQDWANSVEPDEEDAEQYRKAAETLAAKSEYDKINAGLEMLSRLGLKLNCPVLAIAHRNRTGNKADGGLHAAKGSGSIEYKAESVIDLTRKTEQPDFEGKTTINVKLQKNRHGVVGVSLDLSFSGRCQKFSEI